MSIYEGRIIELDEGKWGWEVFDKREILYHASCFECDLIECGREEDDLDADDLDADNEKDQSYVKDVELKSGRFYGLDPDSGTTPNFRCRSCGNDLCLNEANRNEAIVGRYYGCDLTKVEAFEQMQEFIGQMDRRISFLSR